MLVPAPPPTYTISPVLPPLRPGQQRTLDAGITALTGVVASAVVTGVGTAMGRHIIELATASGPVLLLERTAES